MAITVDLLIRNVDQTVPGGGNVEHSSRLGDVIAYKVQPHNGWGREEDPRMGHLGPPSSYPFWLVTLTDVPDEQTIMNLIQPVFSGAENEIRIRNRRWFVDEVKIPNNVLNRLRRDGYQSASWALVSGWLTDRGLI